MNTMPNPFAEVVSRPSLRLPAQPYLPPVILIPPVVSEVIQAHAKRVRKPRAKKVS